MFKRPMFLSGQFRTPIFLLAAVVSVGLALLAAPSGPSAGTHDSSGFERATFDLSVPSADVRGAFVIGPDEREPITNTTDTPWRSMVHLVAFDEFSNILGHCSGSLVDDWTVLTAAHCVWDDISGPHYSILVVPGSNGVGFPLGSGFSYGYSISLPVGYTDSPHLPLPVRAEFDFTLVHLELSDFGTSARPYVPVGSPTDSYLSNPGIFLASAGFPGDKSLGSMWLAAGRVLTYTDVAISTDMDVVPGQSGAPVWLVDLETDDVVTVGVISLHGPFSNTAVRFSLRHLDALDSWCAEAGCSIPFFFSEPQPTPTQPIPTPTMTPSPMLTPTAVPSPTTTVTATATASPTVTPTIGSAGDPGGPPYRAIAPALNRSN